MANQLKWMTIVLLILLGALAINSNQQKKYNAKSDLIFDINRDDVFAFEISKSNESLKLNYDGESWSIENHDSLTVKTNTIGSFLILFFTLKKHPLFQRIQIIGTNLWLVIQQVHTLNLLIIIAKRLLRLL